MTALLALHLRFKNSVKDVNIFPPYFFMNLFLHQLDFQQFQFSCDYLFELKNFVVFKNLKNELNIYYIYLPLHYNFFDDQNPKMMHLASHEAL